MRVAPGGASSSAAARGRRGRARPRSPRRRRRAPARRAHARSFATIPAVAVPPAITRSIRRRIEPGERGRAVVQHTRRRAGDHEPPRAEPRRQAAGQRVGVHVEQPAVAVPGRCTPAPARTGSATSAVISLGSAASLGTPTSPRSIVRPSALRCGGAGSLRPAAGHPRRSARRPATPAVASAATSRVFTMPARIEHDDVQRGGVGDAQAVHLPLVDAGRSAARRRSPVRRHARPPAARRRRGCGPGRRRRPPACAASSSSSPPNLTTRGAPRLTAGPGARRGPAGRSCSAPPAPRRP